MIAWMPKALRDTSILMIPKHVAPAHHFPEPRRVSQLMINDKSWISKETNAKAPTTLSGLHQGGHLCFFTKFL